MAEAAGVVAAKTSRDTDMPGKLAERLKSRTERELGMIEQGERKNRKPKKKPLKRQAGTGKDNSAENFRRLSAGLRTKIDAATKNGNNALAEKLKARLEQLRQATGQ